MAILDSNDFQIIKKRIKNDQTARAEFKVWPLSKQVWKDTFQAAEDWFVNGFNATPSTSFKAALEVEAGAMTNAQAKQIGRVWFMWRVGANP